MCSPGKVGGGRSTGAAGVTAATMAPMPVGGGGGGGPLIARRLWREGGGILHSTAAAQQCHCVTVLQLAVSCAAYAA